MIDELSSYYFLKTLELAQNDDLTQAVQYAAVPLGMNNEDEDCRKLVGLCYYRLGDYAMAEYCFNNSTYYVETIKERLWEKKDRMGNVKQLADKGQYKKAVRELENEQDKNVKEYNCLGCLYAILHKKRKAAVCFLEALKQDHTNEDALRCLKNIGYDKKKRWWKHDRL